MVKIILALILIPDKRTINNIIHIYWQIIYWIIELCFKSKERCMTFFIFAHTISLIFYISKNSFIMTLNGEIEEEG